MEEGSRHVRNADNNECTNDGCGQREHSFPGRRIPATSEPKDGDAVESSSTPATADRCVGSWVGGNHLGTHHRVGDLP